MIALIILGIVIVLLILFVIGIYNALIRLRNQDQVYLRGCKIHPGGFCPEVQDNEQG